MTQDNRWNQHVSKHYRIEGDVISVLVKQAVITSRDKTSINSIFIVKNSFFSMFYMFGLVVCPRVEHRLCAGS